MIQEALDSKDVETSTGGSCGGYYDGLGSG